MTPGNPGNTPTNDPSDNPGNTPGDGSTNDRTGDDSDSGDSKDKKDKGTTPVQTGDRTPVTWLFALLALSGTGIVGSKIKKKSKATE